ncbi:MAG: PRC and DUF2382 domain-containing protein [Acidimicrobiia bacterium]|nr:PRC and DUF2382 domain-containing protein [Acidimicrobiia bacterium]
MTDLSFDDVQTAVGQTLYGGDGTKVGKIGDIYLDQDTRQPEWALVNTGMFGTKESFVPLQGASTTDDGITVRWDKAQIKDAPRAEPDGDLSQDEEAELYRHYGLNYSEAPSDSGLPAGGTETTGRAPVGNDVSGPETDDAMTRSEEELRVDKVKRPSETVRLRKYITTEQVGMTVPVQREEARVSREPITEANRGAAMSGGDLTEEEHELTLSEEEVVVDKQVVPKERVRLDKDVVTEERQVSEEVRKENIEVDGDVDTKGR